MRVEANVPWPFSNRDCVMSGCGTVLRDKHAIVILIRSVTDD